MKVMTIFGTRPEIIRLSLVIKKLDEFCDHISIYTGQNFDPNLSDIFFDQLGVRKPDEHLGVQSSSFASQAGEIIARSGEVLNKYRPDRLLILGDTNSGLSAVVAARMGIPVFHMEAGNRCYDNRVPEEINRRIIDHSSDILLPYTARSKENLVREGIDRHRIFITGNPIYEVLTHFAPQIEASQALKTLGVEAGGYFLVTMHRAENVDLLDRLVQLMMGLDRIARDHDLPVIISVHPRTRDRLSRSGLEVDKARIRLIEPLGFFDFIHLERNARCVISDSGTVQEECSIFQIPNVTIRDVTERPETIECGSNILTGASPDDLNRAVHLVLNQPHDWQAPEEYLERFVSMTVVKIVLGHLNRT